MANTSEREKEADKLMKKANKEISPSLLDFRLKPDWEQAAPSLERAALIYKQIGNKEKALEAYERAATAQEKLSSDWHAAKHYEVCGEICKQMGNTEQVAFFFRRAADAYGTAGKVAMGADALNRGAQAVEALDSDTAIRMYVEALGMYEDDEKESAGLDTYRGCVSAMIKAQRLPEAAQTMMRFAAACEKSGSKASQCKAYLGAVVIHLSNQDAESAWHAFQDAMEIEIFSASNEAFVADSLFDAYRSGDPDAVQKLVTEKSLFKQLDNQVARLAIKLPVKGKFKRVSKAVAKLMRGGEEEQQEQEEDIM